MSKFHGLKVQVSRKEQTSSFRVYDTPSGEGCFEAGGFVINGHLRRKTRALESLQGGQSLLGDTSLQDFDIFGDPIGIGASSKVYKALHRPTQSVVALKALDITEKSNRHQLINELQALLDSAHPHIVTLQEAFFSRSKVFMALEFMDRGSLESIFVACRQSGQTIPQDVLALIITQALVGICFLHEHKRCVHRDLKPANILIRRDGVAKIGDFGIAAIQKEENSEDLDRGQTTFIGTAKYMSPERVSGQVYSFPADVWSIGVIALESHLGRFPWQVNEGLYQLFHNLVHDPIPLPTEDSISPEFFQFLTACLEKDADKRPTARAAHKMPFIQQHISLGSPRIKSWLTTVDGVGDKKSRRRLDHVRASKENSVTRIEDSGDEGGSGVSLAGADSPKDV